MNWLLEPFHHDFEQRAFLVCALIGFTSGFLSAVIVLRRLALMADALSHAVLPGVAMGIIIFGFVPISLFCGALTSALLVGLGAELIFAQLADQGGDGAGDSLHDGAGGGDSAVALLAGAGGLGARPSSGTCSGCQRRDIWTILRDQPRDDFSAGALTKAAVFDVVRPIGGGDAGG